MYLFAENSRLYVVYPLNHAYLLEPFDSSSYLLLLVLAFLVLLVWATVLYKLPRAILAVYKHHFPRSLPEC